MLLIKFLTALAERGFHNDFATGLSSFSQHASFGWRFLRCMRLALVFHISQRLNADVFAQ
jgi:hypothetical protein